MGLSAHNVKVQIMYKIDKWIHFTRKVKSPTSLLQGPQESSLTVEGSIRRKPSFFFSSSYFSMDQEDSNNAMDNSKDQSWHQWMHRTEACHPRPYWPKGHCSNFIRRPIQPLLSQVITPQALKSRFHPWGSSIFLLFRLILFAHLNP